MNTLPRSLLLSVVALASASAAQAAVGEQDLKLNGKAYVEVTGICDNKGSDINLGPGLITIADVPARIVFDGGGTHDANAYETVSISVTLQSQIDLPKQPVHGGVTGNPKISVYLGDSQVPIVGPTRCNKL